MSQNSLDCNLFWNLLRHFDTIKHTASFKTANMLLFQFEISLDSF